MNRITKLFLLVGIFGLISPLKAQIALSPDLQEAVEAALEKSTTLNNRALEREKEMQEIKNVKGKYLPHVSAKAGYAYLTNDLKLDLPTVTLPLTGAELFEGSTTLNNQAHIAGAGITAKQVLFTGGQIANGAKALEKKNEAKEYSSELEKDEIIKEVIHSFDQIRLLEKAEELLRESERRLAKEKERVDKAIDKGLAIPYDRDKIRLAQLNLDSKKEDIAGKKELLFAKIKILTGYDQEKTASVSYDLATFPLPSDLTIEGRNEIKALDALSEALDYNLKKEKGSLLPTLGAFAHVGYGGLYHANTRFPLPVSGNKAQLKMNKAALEPGWAFGVLLSWDIFNGSEKKRAIREVKIDQEILQNKKADALEKMELQLQNNKTQYRSILNRLKISDQKERIAENNLLTAEKQYKLGLISVTERLEAETEIYKISLEKTETLIEQRQAALDVFAASKTLSDFIN